MSLNDKDKSKWSLSDKQDRRIVDQFNNPLGSSTKPSFYQKTKAYLSKGPAVVAVLISITVLLINFGSLRDRYLPVQAKVFQIPVEVENSTDESIEIDNLLDYYLTRAPFYPALLNAGQAPTGRVRLDTTGGPDTTGVLDSTSYILTPGDQRKYVVKLDTNQYRADLERGGSNIVFTLNIQSSNEFLFIEMPFQKDKIESTQLFFNPQRAD